MSIKRYDVIRKKRPREIVLLKSKPCAWSRCTFCDYIHDNSSHEDVIIETNKTILTLVTGAYKALEVINSGSCFELPTETLKDIRALVEDKDIKLLYFESHYMYRHRLDEIRNFFNVPVIFKCGIETFDIHFRNDILNKGLQEADPKTIASFFSSICLMVGIKGQTKAMIQRDVEIGLKEFEHLCINVYVNNSTHIQADEDLIAWFTDQYLYLEENPKVEILWHNTDYGVGGEDE